MVYWIIFYKYFEDKDVLLIFGFKWYGKMIVEILVLDWLSKLF